MKLATYVLLLDCASSLRFISNIHDFQDESTGAIAEQMPETYFNSFAQAQSKKHPKIEVVKSEIVAGVDSTTTIEHDVKAEELPPVPRLDASVYAITKQIPVLENLKRRIPVLEAVEPQLKDLNKQLDELNDFSDMDAARIGGSTIRDIYHVDTLPYVNAFEKAVIKNNIREAGEVAMANQRVANWQDAFDVEKARKDMTVEQMESKIGQLEKEADEEEKVSSYNVKTKFAPNPYYGEDRSAKQAEEAAALKSDVGSAGASPQSIVQAKDKKKSGDEAQAAGAPLADGTDAGAALPAQYVPRPDGVDRLSNFSVQQSMLPNSQQRKPTDFGAELERYEGIAAEGKEYLKENHGEDAPAPIPQRKSELPRSVNAKITMATPSVAESMEDPIAAKIRQGVLAIEARQDVAAVKQEANARRIIANGMSDAHKLGFEEASDIV